MMYRIFVLFFSVLNVFVAHGMNAAREVADSQPVGYKRKFESLRAYVLKNDSHIYNRAAALPALVAHEKRLYGSPRVFGKPRELRSAIEPTSCQEADQYHELSSVARSKQYGLVLFRINNLDIPLMREELMANRVALANIYAKAIEQSLDAIPKESRKKAWRDTRNAIRTVRAEYAQHGERPQKAVRQLLSLR